MSSPRLRLGQLLIDARLITEEDLARVLELQRTDGRRLGALLVESGLVDETQLTQILSHQLSIPWVSLLHIEFSRRLLNLVPQELAERFCVIPIYVRHVRSQGETLYVAMDDPSNEEALTACSQFAGLPVRAMIAPPSDIQSAIRVYYAASATPEAAPDPERKLTPTGSAPPPAAEPTVDVPPKAAADEGPTIDTVELEVPIALTQKLQARAALEALAAGSEEPAPISEREVDVIPTPKGGARRMVSLTLLDGTTIALPPRAATKSAAAESPRAHTELTAGDLVTALRATADGADAREILGESPRWEPIVAAMLSLLLKKHLIADWEFVEEYRRHK